MSQQVSWMVLGFTGQAMFSMRFLVQWIQSERARKSIIPNAFWYFSLLGSSALLVYAIHIKDPVFILGQSVGIFIYTRNLHLIFRENQDKPSAE